MSGRRYARKNRADTKWVFENDFNVDIKVVLDRQPLLGTGPLPKWLRDCARGRTGPMIALDTYQDNLCLWRCIAVHRGSRPDRSTTAARELAKRFFNLIATPQDCRKHLWMNLMRLKNILIKNKFSKIGWVFVYMSLNVWRMLKWYGILEGNHQPN